MATMIMQYSWLIPLIPVLLAPFLPVKDMFAERERDGAAR